MGSNEVIEVVKTAESAKDAYDRIVEGHLTEYGHRYDNGHLGGYGFKILGGMRTEHQARQLAHERLSGMRKGETGFAIELGEAVARDQRKVVKTIKLTRAQLAAHESAFAALQDAIKAKAPLREGEYVESWQSLPVNGVHDPYGQNATYTFKQKTVATEGPKQTRYFVRNLNLRGGETDWAKGHLTQAAAKTAIQTAFAKQTVLDFEGTPASFGIIAETRRADGQPLVKIINEVVGLTTTVEYTILKKNASFKHTGWLFFAVVPS